MHEAQGIKLPLNLMIKASVCNININYHFAKYLFYVLQLHQSSLKSP